MAGTIVADTIQADSTSTLVLKNGVANTPPTIQDSAGTQIGTFCRAWVNFNGTTNVGGFCTIRASFNVTSITDNGTGDYTINFTNALPDVNYSAVYAARIEGAVTITNEVNPSVPAKATGSIRVATLNSTFTATDAGQVNVAIFR
jgi:hypothetical protein